MIKTNTLKNKLVVSIENGRLLGKIKDFYIDDTGKVCCFTVEKNNSLFSRKEKRKSFTVNWEDIATESADVILVRSYREGELDTAKKNDGLGTQSYAAIALLIISVLILLKSCIG